MGLESVELVMAWEEHFGIAIPTEAAVMMDTPRKTIAFIAGALKAQVAPKRMWTREEIEREVCEIIAEQLGVARKSFYVGLDL